MTLKHGIAVVVVALTAGLGLTGCPAQPPTPVCPDAPSGTWWGSWQSTAYPTLRRGTMSAQLTFSGNTVSGTAQLDGSGAGSGTVTGTVDCAAVTLEIEGAQFGESMTVTATLAEDAIGATLTGTYTSAAFTIPTTIPALPETGHVLLAWPG